MGLDNLIRADLHIHSSESFDSIGSIKVKLKKAKKAGLDVISITDHNRIDPTLVGKRIVKRDDIMLVVGEEISTDKGEIIGLFLKKPIKSGRVEDVLMEIKSQEGLVVLPHPFKRSSIIRYPEIIRDVDIIEVWNGRTSFEKNYKSLVSALLNKKYVSCGSDAHFSSEIGRCKIEILSDRDVLQSIETADDFIGILEKVERFVVKGKANWYSLLESLSQFVRFLKNKKFEALRNSLFFIFYEMAKVEKNYRYVEIEVQKNKFIILKIL